MNNGLARVLPAYAVLHGVSIHVSKADALWTLASALILIVVACSTSAQLCVCPPTQLCCPKVIPKLAPLNIPIPAWFIKQCWGCFSSHYPRNSFSLTRSPSVFGIPDSREVNPFLKLGLLALHSRSLIGHKLPCWAVTIRPSPSTAPSKTRPCSGERRSFNSFSLRSYTSKSSPCPSSATNCFWSVWVLVASTDTQHGWVITCLLHPVDVTVWNTLDTFSYLQRDSITRAAIKYITITHCLAHTDIRYLIKS